MRRASSAPISAAEQRVGALRAQVLGQRAAEAPAGPIRGAPRAAGPALPSRPRRPRARARPSTAKACAPSGTLQPPPSASRKARSASIARAVGAWSSGATASRTAASPSRHSSAIAPCPGAGTNCRGSRASVTSAARPSRVRPAIASRIASKRPSRSRLMRVSTFPRRSMRTTSARAARTSAWRRRLVVPTLAPAGSSASRGPEERRASRGSARSRIAHSERPPGSTVGTSLSECTARSTSPASIASSISLRKAPLPPTESSRRSSSRSPVVVMTRSSISCPRAVRCALTCSACHRARALPRVPMRIRLTGRTASG